MSLEKTELGLVVAVVGEWFVVTVIPLVGIEEEVNDVEEIEEDVAVMG